MTSKFIPKLLEVFVATISSAAILYWSVAFAEDYGRSAQETCNTGIGPCFKALEYLPLVIVVFLVLVVLLFIIFWHLKIAKWFLVGLLGTVTFLTLMFLLAVSEALSAELILGLLPLSYLVYFILFNLPKKA
jgi:hypothetical protein